MKYTNSSLIQITDTLGSFKDRRLPQKISYAIMKNFAIFSKEYTIYNDALTKIFNQYNDKMVRGEDGAPLVSKNGVPVVEDDVRDEFIGEINDLLQIEIDIEPYYIDESVFDYDNPKGIYDVLTPSENFTLIELLCKSGDDE